MLRDGDQLGAACRASAPHRGQCVLAVVFGHPGHAVVENIPPPLELEPGEVFVFPLRRFPSGRRAGQVLALPRDTSAIPQRRPRAATTGETRFALTTGWRRREGGPR